MYKIPYESLNYEILKKLDHDETFQVIYDNINYYFKVHFKSDSDKIIFFSNGAVNRKVKTPPVFMRSTWANEIQANCIYIDDRTIHDNNLNIGWGVGTEDRHYLDEISSIVRKMSSILNFEPKNIYYYGSSAGGFMSMLLSCKHIGTTAIVNNPQTSVLEFNKGHVDKLCNTIFPGMEKNEILKTFSTRLNVIDALLNSEHIPRIFYIQNRKCVRDMETQYQPFLRSLKRKNIDEKLFTYILYNDYEADHNPLRKKETVNAINNII